MYDSIYYVIQNQLDLESFLRAFYFYPVTRDSETQYDEEALDYAGKRTLEILNNTPYNEIIDVLEKFQNEIAEVETWNIPMFSRLKEADHVPQIVLSNPGCDYTMIGYFFEKDRNRTAQFKYGETHYKAAMLLGLVYRDYPYQVTYLGKAYMKLSKENCDLIRPKLCIRVPLIQKYLVAVKKGPISGMAPLRSILSEKTAIRRRSCTKQMLNAIFNQMDNGIEYRNRIDWK